jgi:heme exporter protein D
MDWSKLADYGPYVWGAYAVVALALLGELIGLGIERRKIAGVLREARLLQQLAERERAQALGDRQ